MDDSEAQVPASVRGETVDPMEFVYEGEPFGSIHWWAVPRVWLEDPCIRSHHLDLLMIFIDLVERPKKLWPTTRFTTASTGTFSKYSYQGITKIAEYAWQLHAMRFIELAPERSRRPDGESFQRFRFPKHYRAALAAQAPFAKVPQPVLVDRFLEPKLKRTYAALSLANYSFSHGADVFVASRSFLAPLIGCSPRSVYDYAEELTRLGLIRQLGTTTRGKRYAFTNLHDYYEIRDVVSGTRWVTRDRRSRVAERNATRLRRQRSARPTTPQLPVGCPPPAGQ
jgi:hypothetical protein